MSKYIACALLAPTIANALYAIPQPTQNIPVLDAWSPAPTEAPLVPGYDLLNRQVRDSDRDSTCGFVSGSSESSLTCATNLICATNTYLGVAGCCDPSALSSCILPTTCLPSTLLSASCSNDPSCATNPQIAKCTDPGLQECYLWNIVYPKTTMKQYGCASEAFTSTAMREFGVPAPSSSAGDKETVTVTAPLIATPTKSMDEPSGKSTPIGAVVGGTIGGCVVLSIFALAIFLAYRRRKARRDADIAAASNTRPITHYHSHSMTEYKPGEGPYSPAGVGVGAYVENDHKVHGWRAHQSGECRPGAVHRMSDAVPVYPGMGQRHVGVVEAEVVERPVEAPT